MGFEMNGSVAQLRISASVSSDRLFVPKKGSEKICQLLIEDEFGEFDQLSELNKKLVSDWLKSSGVDKIDIPSEFNSARSQLLGIIENTGVMSATLTDEDGGGLDFFLTSENEECGFIY